MSDTYKHKLLYRSRHLPGSFFIRRIGMKEDPWRSFPWHKVPRNDGAKKTLRNSRQKAFRQVVRKMIYNQDYDNIPKKPEGFGWDLD